MRMNFESCIIKKWRYVSRDCEVFYGKKMVIYFVVIYCILWLLRIRLFIRICMRYKFIIIMIERIKDYLFNVFLVILFWLFIVIIDIRNGYVENCEIKLYLV